MTANTIGYPWVWGRDGDGKHGSAAKGQSNRRHMPTPRIMAVWHVGQTGPLTADQRVEDCKCMESKSGKDWERMGKGWERLRLSPAEPPE